MKLISVNVGQPRVVQWMGRPATTGIFKEPVSGRVALGRLNLNGDKQADLSVAMACSSSPEPTVDPRIAIALRTVGPEEGWPTRHAYHPPFVAAGSASSLAMSRTATLFMADIWDKALSSPCHHPTSGG